VVFSISRCKRAGRRWERWPSKIDSNWGKHCCCCWFSKKWPSNRIQNDGRIFEYPQDCSFSDSETEFGKEKAVCTFCSTLLWHLCKGKAQSYLAKTLSLWPTQTKNYLTKLLREIRLGVLPMIPKRSDRVLNGLARHSLSRRKWNSKSPASRPCWNIFLTLKA
jgi:hypothetical protein